jgi:fatty-acid desaturase
LPQANSQNTTSQENLTALEIDSVNWKTSIFLATTLIVALIATPIYLWYFGAGLLELTLFLVWFAAGGMSITVGYHRLLAHRAFNAAAPVRLLTALFGAATFEASALIWCSEHRYHHKYTDQDGDPRDPHNIKRGFFWAHVGWLLVYVTTSPTSSAIPSWPGNIATTCRSRSPWVSSRRWRWAPPGAPSAAARWRSACSPASSGGAARASSCCSTARS